MVRTFIVTISLLLGILPANAEPFKVGLAVPLSGSVSLYGEVVRKGINLFQKDHPHNNLKFIYEDTRYDGATSISAFNKLVDQDKVDIVYAWGTTPSAAIAPIAEFKKFPTILLTGDKEINKAKEFSIDFSDELGAYSKADLEVLRKKGYKKIAIVKTEMQYLEGLVEGLKENLKADESLDILGSFQPGAQVNLQSTLTKLKLNLKQNKYDVVGVFLENGQLSSFYKKMHALNIKIPTFGSDFFDSIEERRESGESIVGAFWSTFKISKEFEQRYRAEYNSIDQITFAAGAYELASLLNDLFSEAYKNNQKLSSKEILAKIESIKERDGVNGKIYFKQDNPDSDPLGGKRFKFPIVIKEVTKDGGEKVITLDSENI